MPYSSIGSTCRFYINALEWLAGNGVIELDDRFRTLPVVPSQYEWVTQNSVPLFTVPSFVFSDQSFAAILGHDLSANNTWAGCSYTKDDEMTTKFNEHTNIVNYELPDTAIPYDGFSIFSFDATNTNTIVFAINQTSNIGSIVLGTFYEMPRSAEPKVTVERQMDGFRKVRTRGGNDLVASRYTKPAKWGSAAAWELYQDTPTNQELARVGRRTWSLSWNALKDSDIFPMLSSLDPFESTSPTGEVYTGIGFGGTSWSADETLLESDNFYSQVVLKSQGGQLPLIFQPDTSSQELAIVKLNMDSFEFEQISHAIYKCSIKLKEIW